MTFHRYLQVVDCDLTAAIETLQDNAESIIERGILCTPEIQRVMSYSRVLRTAINSDAAMQIGQRAFRDTVIPIVARRRLSLEDDRKEVLDEVIEGLERRYDHSYPVDGIKKALRVVKRDRNYDIYQRIREVVTPERYQEYIKIIRDYLPR